MKKILIALCTAVVLSACGGKEESKVSEVKTPEVVQPVVEEKVLLRVAKIPTTFSCGGSTLKHINNYMAVMREGGQDYMGQLYADGSYFVHEVNRINMMPSAIKLFIYGEFVAIGQNANMDTVYSVDVKVDNSPWFKAQCVVPRYAQWRTFDPNPKEEVKKEEPVTEVTKPVVEEKPVVEVAEAISTKASFSCEGKLSLVEQLICDTPELSMKDAELAIAYREARKNGDEAAVKSQQRVWMKQRNNCTTSACVHEAYATRLKELSH